MSGELFVFLTVFGMNAVWFGVLRPMFKKLPNKKDVKK